MNKVGLVSVLVASTILAISSSGFGKEDGDAYSCSVHVIPDKPSPKKCVYKPSYGRDSAASSTVKCGTSIDQQGLRIECSPVADYMTRFLVLHHMKCDGMAVSPVSKPSCVLLQRGGLASEDKKRSKGRSKDTRWTCTVETVQTRRAGRGESPSPCTLGNIGRCVPISFDGGVQVILSCELSEQLDFRPKRHLNCEESRANYMVSAFPRCRQRP